MAPKKVEAKGKAKAEPKAKAEVKAAPAAEKRKAAEEKKEEPPKKEAKKEEPKPVEAEKDAPSDTRKKVGTVMFEPKDTTLNVVPTLGGKMLMALTDGGMQYLVACARANIGVTKGRYAFEIKVAEHLAPLDIPVPIRKGAAPKQLVRVGVSAAESDLILGETEACVWFDSEGNFYAGGKKLPNVVQKIGKDQVAAFVLNMDKRTVTLFLDGKRACEPQPLPEELHGKALFPHIAYRNVSVQVNFGEDPLKPLPFKCRLLQDAAQADTKTAEPSVSGKDGKHEVLFPVAFPDQGTFEWLDGFLASNPQYVELSDRKILDWALKSGLARPVASINAATVQGKSSNDKPSFCFGVQPLDDLSLRHIIASVAPLVPRHYVVMEVKENLVAVDRAENLKRFPAAQYNRKAIVVMGKPAKAFQDKQLAAYLEDKQAKAVEDWKKRKADKERKKAQDIRMKQVQKLRQEAEDRRKKAAEDMKKKQDEAKKRAEEAKAKAMADVKAKVEAAKKKKQEEAAKKAKEEAGESADAEMEDVKAEETKDEPMEEAKEEPAKDEPKEEAKEEPKEEAKEEAKEEEEDEEPEEWEKEPPVVELTEEEKSTKFQPKGTTDLTPAMLSAAYAKFSIPEKAEGFSDIKFEWDNEAASKSYLQKWVAEQKITCRIDSLQPGKWFKETSAAWTKVLREWQAKQKAYKPTVQKKEKKEGEEGEDEEMEEEDEVDVNTVEDVCDVGEGKPLFKDFGFEDWTLVQLRYELYLTVKGFLKDVEDDDRTGIPENHFDFYYGRYFSKKLVPKFFGVESLEDLFKLTKDVVAFKDGEHKLLELKLAEEPDSLAVFIKLVEEQRRERQRRIDAGDETAKIKFLANCMMARVSAAPAAGVTPVASSPVGSMMGRVSPVAPGMVRPRPAGVVSPPGAWMGKAYGSGKGAW